MKKIVKKTLFLVFLSKLSILNSLFAQPENIDIIVLVDVSGSMEFTHEGGFPIDPPGSELRRIDYVIPGLQAFNAAFNRMEVLGVDSRRFAFGRFPGETTSSDGTVRTLFAWLPLPTSGIRDHTSGEWSSIVSGLDITWFGTPLATAVLAAVTLHDATDPPTGAATSTEVIMLLTDGRKRESERIYDVDANGNELQSTAATVDDVRNEIRNFIDHSSSSSDDNRIKIISLGFGDNTLVGSETDFEMLTDISVTTPAGYNPVVDDANFTKDFVFNVFSSLGWAIADPTFLIQPGATQEHITHVTQYDGSLLFMVSWKEPKSDSTIQFTMMSPKDSLITPQLVRSHPEIYYDSGRTFQMYTLRESLIKRNIGEWKLLVNGENIGEPEWYAYSILGGSRLQLRDVTKYQNRPRAPGDSLKLSVSLTADGTPITDAVVKARLSGPTIAAGNWFQSFPLSPAQRDSVLNIQFPGFVSDVYKKFFYMHHLNDVTLPNTTMSEFDFTYDPSDSLYHLQTPPLIRPGGYKIEISASHGAGETSRFFQRSLQQFNYISLMPDLNWHFSSLDFAKILETAEYDRYRIKFTPRDRYSNYAKPGQASHIKFRPTNASLIDEIIEDDLEGSYYTTIQVAKNVLQPTVDVGFNNQFFDRRNITINPVEDNWRFNPNSLTLRFGPAFPIGVSSDIYDPTVLSFSADFSRQINRHWAWRVSGGLSKFSGIRGTKDLTYWNFNANLNWVPVVLSNMRIYTGTGGGLYIPDEGSSNPGLNIVAGIQFALLTWLDFEIRNDYHNIIRSGADFRYNNLITGLNLRF